MSITAILGRKGSLLKTSQNLSAVFKLSGIRTILAQKELLEKRKKNAKLRVLALKGAGDAINQKNAQAGLKDSLLGLGGTILGSGVGGGRTRGIRGGNIRGRRPFLNPNIGRNRGITRGNRLSRFRLPFNRARVTSSGGRLSGLGRNLRGLRGLKGLGRVGPLNVLFTGADFLGRKASGQTNFQAGGGALAGLGGFLGGAKAGAAAGGAIGALFGGVGAAPGALIGGFIGGTLGSIAASGIFDRLSGADKRRVNEAKRISPVSKNFNLALNDLESALDKLEGKRIVDDDALVLPGDNTRGVTGGKFGIFSPSNISQAMLAHTFNRGFASGVVATGTAAAVFMIGRGLIRKVIKRLFHNRSEFMNNRAALERAFNKGYETAQSDQLLSRTNPRLYIRKVMNKKIRVGKTMEVNPGTYYETVPKVSGARVKSFGSNTRGTVNINQNRIMKNIRQQLGLESKMFKMKKFSKANNQKGEVFNSAENINIGGPPPNVSDASTIIIEGDTIIQNGSGSIATGNSSGGMTRVDDFQVALNIIQGTSLLTV